MPYQIRRCKICNQEIHVHKKASHYELSNACEHIPETMIKNIREHDIKELLKANVIQ